MTLRWRIVVLAAVAAVAVLGATGYVVYAHRKQADAQARAPKVATTDLAAVAAVPHLVFRNTALGNGYGRAALVPLSNPDGPRALTPASCDRLYARSGEAICLAAQRGLVTTYQARLLTPQWTYARQLPLSGLPSRARISPDGSLLASTVFVFGDSYANPGQFSTRTLIARTSGEQVADVERFRFTVDGRVVNSADKNVWGVTFADDDTFYATAASGGRTWLAKGSISAGTLTALRGDVECPSLSPDGTPDRVQATRHAAARPVAAGGVRPAYRRADPARRAAQRGRPGGVAGQRHDPVRAAGENRDRRRYRRHLVGTRRRLRYPGRAGTQRMVPRRRAVTPQPSSDLTAISDFVSPINRSLWMVESGK